ncbi:MULTISPECIES: hypothetical protein [Streptomyces]|uniref:hypothetical protein n=1 Tax=Streptomyces TaxID=1883 RepID=UPI0016703C42|nr:hypothetical protein [Streptomyces ruber]
MPVQPRGERWQSLRSFFLTRFLLALPEDPVEAFSALFEPVRKAFRLLLRLLNGPGMRGGWDSDAGRLVLAVHTAYWRRDALRTEEADCLLVVADGQIAVRALWQDPSRAVACPHAGLRHTPWPRRLRRCVGIACTDGSWFTVRTTHPHTADQIRTLLAP